MKPKIILTLMLLWGFTINAQTMPESYYFQRGLEAFKDKNIDEAIRCFNKDIEDNPKNGYSHSWIAMLCSSKKEYNQAIIASNMAIKYLPKEDKKSLAFAYTQRAEAYLSVGDTIKALDDYTSAIGIIPNESLLYKKRAQIYLELGDYDKSEADYNVMIDLNPDDLEGFIGLGLNANAQGIWNDALDIFHYVIRHGVDTSLIYASRAKAYIGTSNWENATYDIINSLSIDWDSNALYLMLHLEEPARSMLISKMKVKSEKERGNMWNFYIGLIYEKNKQYKEAIEHFFVSNIIEESSLTYYYIAKCYQSLGDFVQSLKYITNALELGSDDIDYMSHKANIYYELGEPVMGILEWNNVLAKYPEYAWGYYRRGWFKKLVGDYEGAIKDLSKSIVLEPNYVYSYSARGDIYQKQGKLELAKCDYNKIIEIENTPDKYECIHFAYHRLGMKEKAIDAINLILARDSTDAGNYYDASCLYARMDDKENALKYLEQALKLGYKRFSHIERDSDLELIRNTEEFKTLIDKYNSRNN